MHESIDSAQAIAGIASERWSVGAIGCAARPLRHHAPCLAAGSVWSGSINLSDRDDILSKCKLLESVAGAVHVHRDAPARQWDALKGSI